MIYRDLQLLQTSSPIQLCDGGWDGIQKGQPAGSMKVNLKAKETTILQKTRGGWVAHRAAAPSVHKYALSPKYVKDHAINTRVNTNDILAEINWSSEVVLSDSFQLEDLPYLPVCRGLRL